MGGSCSMINPLPMSEFVDVFALGAAENLLPALLPLLEEEAASRDAVLERLARNARLLRAGAPPSRGRPRAAERRRQAAQARALGRADAAARASAHQRDRHAAHRVRRQVPGRDVARLPGEVPLLLGDLRHGHLPLAPGRLHPRLARARAQRHRPARLPRHRRGRSPRDRAHPRRGAHAGLPHRGVVDPHPGGDRPRAATRCTARATARSRWRPRPARTSCGSRWASRSPTRSCSRRSG